MKYAAAKNVKLHVVNGDNWTGLTEDGHFTNGYYSVIPIGSDSIPKEMYDKEPISAIIPTIVPDVEYFQVEYEKIIQERTFDKKGKVKYYDILCLRFCDDLIYLNREYVDTILCRYPGAVPWVSDKFHAVVFKHQSHEYEEGEKIVDIVMPIILD